MKILFLTTNNNTLDLVEWLIENKEEVTVYSEKLTQEYLKNLKYELIISYNYKYLIPYFAIEKMNGNIINLHISYLPWNRGANPNVWSIIEDTPKGVTIHFVDEGLDTGMIIAQKKVELSENETLRSSYNILHFELKVLFKSEFLNYNKWKDRKSFSLDLGSYHDQNDFKKIASLIENWDMRNFELKEHYKEYLNKKIFIRVDGNDKIGLGHIMRTMSIAKALEKDGINITFILSDKMSESVIQKNGFKTYSLISNYKNMESEVSELINFVVENKVKLLLIDSYQITEKYLKEVGNYVTIFLMDDFGEKTYPVKGIINYNITSDFINYKKLYHTDTQLLLGCQYLPLREEFQKINPITIKKNVENVLVTTGGSDPLNISEKLMKMICDDKNFDQIHFHFVCGSFYSNMKNLKSYEKKNLNIHLHENVTKMSELMLRCDLAISAGGSTLYELCACGLPTLCFSFADNQDQAVTIFGKKNCMVNLGRWQENSDIDVKKQLSILMKNYALRKRLHETMCQVANKNGAENLAKALIFAEHNKE